MFKLDLIVLFLIMGTLFIRQIMIFKNQNKIDYAPIIIGIGVLGSLLHFITHPQITDLILLLRESFLPIVIAIFLYLVLSVVNQIHKTDENKQFNNYILDDIEDLKNALSNLENRVINFSKEEKKAQDEVIEKLRVDIKSLNSIELNQTKFLQKFDQLSVLYEDVSLSFREFTELKMPELDTIVHKHIDIIRIANQDHFNHLNSDLNKILISRQEMLDEGRALRTNLIDMKNLSNNIAISINNTIIQQLKEFTKPLEAKSVALKLSSEAILDKLDTSEKKISTIKQYSEAINKEIALASKNMQEFDIDKNSMLDIYTISKKMIYDIEEIKNDYIKSQTRLEIIAKDFKISEKQQIEDMKKQIELLGEMLVQKKVTNEEITKNLHLLSQQTKLKNGYMIED